jgi:D-alanine-D-alanine ligase-like ATP-grasp enzyme
MPILSQQVKHYPLGGHGVYIFEAPLAKLDPMAQHIERAARERNLTTITKIVQFDRKMHAWVTFTIGNQEFYYINGALLLRDLENTDYIGRNLNHEAALLIADKHKAKVHLESRGFTVPKGLFFRRRKLKEAYEAFSGFSGPICVKPNNGLNGDCVSTGLTDEVWYKRAVDKVAEKYPTIVVEESVEGEHFRFLYVAPEVVGIRHTRPANVVGDGVSTIRELVNAKNTIREHHTLPPLPPLSIDTDMREFLERHGRCLTDVPLPDERVFLRGISHASGGADSDLVWEEVHPSYREIVVKACQATQGLHYSGVDIVIKDHTVPAAAGNYWLLELNASPAIDTWDRKFVDVAGKILNMLIQQYGSTDAECS